MSFRFPAHPVPIAIVAAVCAVASLLPAQEGAVTPTSALDNDALELLFPLDKPWLGVRIPKYDASNILKSVLLSETVTRYDRDRLQLDGLTISMLNEDGTLSVRMTTPKAIYDLETEKLKSRTRALIEHKQFDMWGDVLNFDTAAQKGDVTGNVEMLIYSSGGAMVPTPNFTGSAESSSEDNTSSTTPDNSSSEAAAEPAATSSASTETKELP